MGDGRALSLGVVAALAVVGAVVKRRRGSTANEWQQRRDPRWFALGQRRDDEIVQGKGGDEVYQGFRGKYGYDPDLMLSYDPMEGTAKVQDAAVSGMDLYDGWNAQQGRQLEQDEW